MSGYVHRISDEESLRIRRFIHFFAIGTVTFAVLIILAIMTAHHWILWISSESERRFIQPYVTWAEKTVLPQSDPVLQAYVADLAQQIAADMDIDADMRLDFRVLKGGTVNAFTMLGGYIFVFEGLVQELDNENSLAMVLAHEIAHARNRDPLLGTGRGILLGLLISSVSGGGIDPSTVDAGSDLMLNAYSREQEENADRLAIAALQNRYGHVGGATQLFRALRGSGETPETMEILSSHPNLDQRIEYIETMAAENGWARRATTPYPPDIEQRIRKLP
jgi:predicted Zn-dependent protease